MNKDKLIERVRKLYAMAQDTSSPNEAAIAAARVTKLMESEGITLADITKEQTEFGTHSGADYGGNFPAWVNYMAVPIAKLNDCIGKLEAVRVNGKARTRIVFQGFDVDALAATLMLDYLIQAGGRQWKALLKSDREMLEQTGGINRGRDDFRIGFARAIVERLNKINAEREANKPQSDGRSLMVVKAQLVADKYGAARYGKGKAKTRASVAAGAGYAAGMQTGLNSQVGTKAPNKAISA